MRLRNQIKLRRDWRLDLARHPYRVFTRGKLLPGGEKVPYGYYFASSYEIAIDVFASRAGVRLDYWRNGEWGPVPS